MRWVLGIVVVVVLAFLGYEAFRPESRPPVAESSVQPATPAAGTQAPPTAADQTSTADQTTAITADRTKALEEQAMSEAQQAAKAAALKMQATAERVAKAAQAVASSTTALQVGDTDVGKGLTDAVNGVTATLGTITDQASAQAAVPKLVEIDARLYELKPKIDGLPDDARKTLASLVTGMLPKVQSAIDRVQATPGASEAIKPTLDPIMTKLDDWSRQPA
jgi:cytoskeletal protein RodZ